MSKIGTALTICANNVCVCVCLLSIALGKEFTGLLEKQERHVMLWTGKGRRRRRGKSTKRPPHYITRQEICSRERERERETRGRHAYTALVTLSSEASHISSLSMILLRFCTRTPRHEQTPREGKRGSINSLTLIIPRHTHNQ